MEEHFRINVERRSIEHVLKLLPKFTSSQSKHARDMLKQAGDVIHDVTRVIRSLTVRFIDEQGEERFSNNEDENKNETATVSFETPQISRSRKRLIVSATQHIIKI